MNLTVGPQPPAVYWRRRALVLGAILVVILLFVAMCHGGSNSGRHGGTAQGSGTGNPTPGNTSSLLTPIIGDGGEGGSAESTSSPGAGGQGASAPGGDGTGNQPVQQPSAPPCTDSQITVTVTTEKLQVGYYLTMTVKNISGQACSRDVGTIPQEIHILDSTGAVVWSSDYCQNTTAAPDVRYFAPNVESQFRLYWDGHKVTAGCVKGSALSPGSYQVVAKLDTKVSAPVALSIGGTDVNGK